MSDTTNKETTVKYVNKDFASLKRDLMRHAQANFSGSFQDFNETSPGMAILELQAYIGDVLAHYMDQAFLETKKETARQLRNVEDFAKMRGYKPRGRRAARVQLKFIVEVPATSDSTGIRVPDYTFAPIIKAGSSVRSETGIMFETIEDLDMSQTSQDNETDIVPSRADNAGNPTFFALRRQVEAIAATTTEEEIVVGDFRKFLRVSLASSNVQEILSVLDSEGNEWYEVDYLPQNVIFDQMTNTDQDAAVVPYILKLRTAPRRFVFDYSAATDTAYLQFGSGEGLSDDAELIPNVADYLIPRPGRRTFSNFSLDPQNFVRTRSLGLSPSNTTLTVSYRTGGGEETNVESNTINTAVDPILEFASTSLDQEKVSAVRASVEVNNPERSRGGAAAETIAEIKVNADGHFATQRRCVTPSDYIAHVLSLPTRFGKAEKVFVTRGPAASNTVQLHILSLDENGHLSHPTNTLKSNIIKYLSDLRMMTEGVDILSGKIINIGVDFGVVISPRFNRSEVLTECLKNIKEHLSTDKMQVGQPIVVSEISTILQNVKGVVSVYRVDFKSFKDTIGLGYSSDITFDVVGNTENGIIYCPDGAIFEVKYPENDIKGESR